MSATRRQQHQQLVLRQRLRTDLARNLQCLRDTGRGPTVPGPWWPVGHGKWRSEAETVDAWREEDALERHPLPWETLERLERVAGAVVAPTPPATGEGT